MKILQHVYARFRRPYFSGESGASMVEYGLVLALIAVVVIVAVTEVGDVIADMFEGIADSISGAGEES